MPAEPERGDARAARGEEQRSPALFVRSAAWRDRDEGPGWDLLLSEFLAALLVWGGLGWLADRWLGTEPWLLILGLLLGNGLGLYLVWLRTTPRPPAQREADERVR